MSVPKTRFADIAGIDPRLATVLERREMEFAFPVQAAVIPVALKGSDVLVQSPTGSGKTLAFGIPIVERLKRDTSHASAVILVPTRELAVQVAADLAPIATGKQLRVVAVYGGAPIQQQAKNARNAAIIVATPGRLEDLMRTKKVDLRQVNTLVLDEADRMLDMGFQPQVDAIVDKMPRQRQTMLFSATLEGRIAKVIGQYTNDPETITTAVAPGAGGEIKHLVWQTSGGTKVDTVLEALEMERDLAVVFVRTKRSADTLMGRLRSYGVRATAIHGGMSQSERLREYGRFQRAQVDVLVATDVFARGMDLDRITMVINYDIPEDADTYRHRSGRTGRAGRTGLAITMMTSAQRKPMRRMIREAGLEMSIFDDVRHTRQTRREPLPEGQHFTPAAGSTSKDRPSARAVHARGASVASGTARSGQGGPKRGRPQATRPGSNPHAKFGQQRGARGATGGTGTGGGEIVSYDPKKGFGFITPERGGPDVFFHRNILQGVDPHALQRGVKVAFSAQQHERGVRASDMRLLETTH